MVRCFAVNIRFLIILVICRWYRSILVQCVAVNIGVLLTVFIEVAGNVFLWVE
jgi:hypothetical protein